MLIAPGVNSGRMALRGWLIGPGRQSEDRHIAQDFSPQMLAQTDKVVE
jgi:hypothetical protein